MQVQNPVTPFRLSVFSVFATLLGNVSIPHDQINLPQSVQQLTLQIIGISSAVLAIGISGWKSINKARREEKLEDEKVNKESLVAQIALLKIQLEEEQSRFRALKEMSDEYKHFIKAKIEKLESDSSTLAKILRIIHRQIQSTDTKVDSKLAPLIEIVKQHQSMIGDDSKDNVPVPKKPVEDKRKKV